MAMTLRLTDEQSAALRTEAEAEGISMQQLTVRAIEQYLAGRRRREHIDAILDVEMPRYADALERLGQ